MVAYNFQARFAEAVSTRQKRQTIRAKRKTRHARKGEPVQLYTGLRSKAVRKLVSPDPVCINSLGLTISDDKITYAGGIPEFDVDGFAQRDGFKDFADMKAWFGETHGLPFEGQLIMWDDNR